MKRMSIVFLILIIVVAANQKEQTPAERWDIFINEAKDLGREVLGIDASQAWIEKHSDEISLPNQIAFGEPYPVQDFGFTPYGIVIAVDLNEKRRVIAWQLPPEKTLLKVGDKLTYLFPRNATGQIYPVPKEKNDNVFVFEAKQKIVHPHVDSMFMGADTFMCSTYMSLEGATVSYNHDWIVTNIEGAVFRRKHDLLYIAFGDELSQEKMLAPQQWEHFMKRQKAFGREVLSVDASQAWIEKHSDAISLPNQIAFGEPYPVQDFGFALYGIVIAVDPDKKRRVIAKKLPPEKTLLKVGDPLPFSFFGFNNREAFKLLGARHDEILNRTHTFVFEAGQPALYAGIPMPKKTDDVDDTDFMDHAGPDKYTIYTSPKGATLSYMGHLNSGYMNVTKIEGTVFQRTFDLTALATALLE